MALMTRIVSRVCEATRPVLRLLFGEAFADDKFAATVQWKCVLVQKVLGFNREGILMLSGATHLLLRKAEHVFKNTTQSERSKYEFN